MTDSKPFAPSPLLVGASVDAMTAGAMLRAAREKQGTPLAVLAASIKVSAAKLEALEADRYADLPDATFTRALAKSLCKALQIDAEPVLARLPEVVSDSLGRVDTGLNEPFRDRPGRVVPGDLIPWRHPVLWLVLVLLLGAGAFVWWPAAPLRDQAASAAADAASVPVLPPSGAGLLDAAAMGVADAASAVMDSAAPASATATATASSAAPAASATSASSAAARAASVASAPVAVASAVVGAAPRAASDAAGESLLIHAREATWVQVIDGTGRSQLSRLLPAGETVAFNAVAPLRLKIGNVRGTELSFRGKSVDLAPVNRDNIASFTLPTP